MGVNPYISSSKRKIKARRAHSKRKMNMTLTSSSLSNNNISNLQRFKNAVSSVSNHIPEAQIKKNKSLLGSNILIK